MADIKVGDEVRDATRAAMKRYEEKPPANRRSPEAMPTWRQYHVLETLWVHKMTAKQICVRSDVLWRMEERGWVARRGDPRGDVWHILRAGEQAAARWRDKNLGPEG